MGALLTSANLPIQWQSVTLRRFLGNEEFNDTFLAQQRPVSECQNAPVVKSVQCIFDSDDRPSGKCPV